MKTIHRDIVAACIFSKEGKLFMGMKDPAKGGVYADCWHIPGGGVENGESKIQALIREMKEEVGLQINPSQVKLLDDLGTGESIKKINGKDVLCKMKFTVYTIQLNEESQHVRIQLNDDLVKYVWVETSNIKDYRLTPPSIVLFKRLGYL